MPVEIQGLSDLSDILTTVAPSSAKRYMRKAMGAGADIVQQELSESAPTGIGILEESIVQKASFDGGDGTTELTIDIGPTKQTFYGSFQEFGTQEVSGTDKSGKHFHHAAQPAQHWMTRGWEGCRDKVLDVVATEMVGLLQDLENRS